MGINHLLYLSQTLVLTTSAAALTVEDVGLRLRVITCGQPMILAVVVS